MKKDNTKNSKKSIRVRFAPSPTGFLHVGGARTALYNFLLAQKMNGQFVLRIEDTDEERSQEDYVRSLISDLKWLGLKWDEGVNEDLEEFGDYGPYRQSQRKEIYNQYVQKLLEQGQAYYCFLTEEELDEQRQAAKAQGVPFRPQSPYRNWTLEQAQEHLKLAKASIRFKNNYTSEDFSFKDLVRGDVQFPGDMIGDFVLVRSSGMPVYNFVCAIDDALMEITHVFRAEEHLSNTLKQLMLYKALDFQPPTFGHLSIMLGKDRQKLSKRHGAASITDFKMQGYLPEALCNFIALVGWSSPSGEEIRSLNQMISEFSMDRFNPSSAIFDTGKCRWMNSHYLRHLDPQDLWSRLEPFLEEAGLKFKGDNEWKSLVLRTYKKNMETLSDGPCVLKPLSETPLDIQDSAREVLAWENSKTLIKWLRDEVEKISTVYPDFEILDHVVARAKSELAIKGKFLFMPLRVALIGQAQGTEIKELFPLLRKEVILQRIDQVLA